MSLNYLIVPQKQRIPVNTGTPSRFGEAIGVGLYDGASIDYLSGCAAAGLEGAQQVIDAIEKYQTIRIEAE